jgi:hypothetical protein
LSAGLTSLPRKKFDVQKPKEINWTDRWAVILREVKVKLKGPEKPENKKKKKTFI